MISLMILVISSSLLISLKSTLGANVSIFLHDSFSISNLKGA